MAVLKPQVIVAGSFTPQESRPDASANGVIVARVGRMTWTKRWAGIYIKNMPYTTVFPRLGQMEARVHFGKTAKEAAGRHGLVNGLPPVAAYIQEQIKGKYRAEDRLNPADYPSKHRRTYHTMAELEDMIAKAKQRQAMAARAAGVPTL